MNFKTLALLLASASYTSASPLADGSGPSLALDRRQCVVNAGKRDTWVEDGLTRISIDFSSEGINMPDEYCRYWNSPSEHGGGDNWFNPQCWMINDRQGQADVSFFRGPQGDAEMGRSIDRSITWWQGLTGCSTG